MATSLCPPSGETNSPSREITSFSHADRIDLSLRKDTALKQSGNRFCINAIILCFAAADGFHEQSIAEDERDVSFMAEIGEPVPAQGCFTGDGESVLLGGEFEFIDSAFEFSMQQLVAFVIEHTEGKRSGMEVKAAAVNCAIESWP